jgi:hypothetical protein
MSSRKPENLFTPPAHPLVRTLAQLVLALELEVDFPVTERYALDLDRFNLGLEILREWRLDRYYAGKAKLFDISVQMADLPPHQD